MPKSAEFWNKIAEGYANSKIRDERAYEKKLEITQKLFPPHAEVLEIACGTGTTALRHAPHVAKYLATDISSKMLEIARKKAEDQDVNNVTFAEEDIGTANWPPAQYDTVLAMSILHLLPDRPAGLVKIHDTLKPGGRFISSTVCLGNMAFFFPLLIRAMKLIGKAPKVVDSLTHEELAAAITEAGFVIEDHHRMSKDKVAFIVARKPE
ncbi:Ubiquinone/menaquinone biosynthesis C-methylase UbiE [Parasphingorhabdus marina DSM 22363]|uniref:Ubiquinone/menaquinone biosynthesis C-methylase UbiE n=1 Tax=Parasphingorhabdus marina DSM 22363 TaxID=1123272 RepID=A0A1N6H6X1_9SPHN|nr:class I SAM-dependent methyltransferase [Parasphingorhabdus marina]SIO15551.1 Ubiquinone/menaquinone biosynthesis C-methylase UbiE [Parasphingorhabdus marina DSM 22363]